MGTESAGNLDILIVEDNPGDVLLLKEYISMDSDRRFDLHDAETLREALALLAKHTPDVILLDLGLPDGQGATNVTALRAAQTQAPIVVLTGTDDDDLAQACLKEGAEDYIWKGEIRGASIRRAIRNAITRHREKQERDRLTAERNEALTRVLAGYLPICSYCKSIRNEQDRWLDIADYMQRNTEMQPSHTICPDCIQRMFPDNYDEIISDMKSHKEKDSRPPE